MVDIPVELFFGFIGISFVLIVIGLVRKPMIPALIVFSGMFILTLTMVTDNIVFGSRIDNIVATESTFNITTSTVSIPQYSYNVITGTTMVNIDGSGITRSVSVEYASTGSSLLVGDTIECISLPLQDVGTASTGTVTIGTFSGSGNVVTTFGTIDAGSLVDSPMLQWYEFCLPEGQAYTIQSGDRLGVKFTNDLVSNQGIATRTDTANPFDGTISFEQRYVASWASSTANDINMQLYRYDEFPNNVQVAGIGGIYTYESDTFEFTEMPKTLFAFISVVLMLVGALVTKMDME